MISKKIKIGDLIKKKEAHSQTGPFGTELKASEYVKEGIPVINVKNIGFGNIRKSKLEYVNEQKAKAMKSHSLKENDIVFGRKGAVERHVLIKKECEGWIQGSDCIRLRFLTEKINPVFVSYYFRSQLHKQWMINLGSFGSTMTSLNQGIVKRIEIPDVSLEVQNSFAEILTAYDDLIENNNQRIRILEETAAEIYREWFVRLRFPEWEKVRFLDKEGKVVEAGTEGALPEGWKVNNLRHCIKHYIGGGWGKETVEGKFTEPAHVLRGTDIPNFNKGKLNFDVLRFHTKSNLSNRSCKPLDIIFEVSGGTEEQSLGRTVLVTQKVLDRFGEDLIAASFCKLMRVDKIVVSPILVYSFLNRLYETGELKVFQVQSTGISNYQFEDFIDATKIAIPAKTVQDKFDRIVESIWEEVQTLGEKNTLLCQTRDLLLPRLISGKLQVSEAVG